MRDVLIDGRGLRRINAAWELRELDVELLEANPEIGGRAAYTDLGHRAWVNWGGVYCVQDRVRCAELVRASGVEIVAATPPMDDDLVSFGEMGMEWPESDVERWPT